ncbi:torsin-3A isoform X2 [Diceros bicornis minor]|uniref:torsin-3A isoform X2 n=1 Tax=Diceros bicornis minor TaxID=77932 RepID=UPI0026EC7A53|nr:torsin-3A isoform X2 [Diceros bicornis minor]
MLRGPRRPLWLCLCLCLLLLLLLPGAPGHRGDAGPRNKKAGSGRPWPAFQGLQERLRAAGALSRRYWALFSCRVWPENCEEDEEALAGTLGLKSDLSVRLHGQHLAGELILRTVRGYLELPRPDKALVLSFHGWSGTGKNFVARMLAENLYRDGLRSDCVKVFIATFHFPHPKFVDLYKERLTGQIRETQERCRQTLFIFDEAEKLHPELLEALRPHLGRQAPENYKAQSLRTIFLFLSNLGSNIINEEVLNLLKAGWLREEITLEHLEPRLQAQIVESTDSAFGHSCLVKENLIDFFVPFLPLEYRHVRLCARDAFLSQELLYTEEALDEIAKMMVYVPKEEQLFSSQGCKSISQRINYFLP